MTLDSYYFGIINKVFPPNVKENVSKYQYEYEVVVTVDNYAQIPVRCIAKDLYGTQDDFEDIIFQVSAKVMVQFPRGDRSLGVICHSTRNYPIPLNPDLGRHWRNRFNKIVRYIDKNGNYSIFSDSGPNFQLNIDKIILDDSVGEKITLDKANKILTINSNALTVEVKENATINIAKNANLTISGDCSISVKGKADISVTKDATVKAKNVEVTADSNAKITATKISLNGESGDVLTTVTDQVVDYITGIPTVGVPTVKAGG